MNPQDLNPQDLAAAVQPEALKAALAGNADRISVSEHAHPGSEVASVRSLTYKGHEIVIRTKYEITVDGNPFEAHLIVDNGGRVHYHGLPTRDFSSAVALVQTAIDIFPGDFPMGGTPHEDGEPHDDGDSHEHSHDPQAEGGR